MSRYAPLMVSRALSVGLVVGVVAVAASSCVDATEVTLVLTTSAPCSPGIEADIYTTSSAPGATAKTCNPSQPNNDIGSIVLVPSSSDSGQVLVRVVASIDTSKASARDCADRFAAPAPNAALLVSCVEAKRAVSFIQHKGLRLPINIDTACAGFICPGDTTCIAGVCQTPVVTCLDDGTCAPPPSDAGPPDTGVRDAGLLEASVDAMPSKPPAIPASIVANADGTCVITAKGNVQCWGYNVNGQLGDQSKLTTKLPVPVDIGVPLATKLALGSSHACALLSGGAIRCWGTNANGEIDPAVKTLGWLDTKVSGSVLQTPADIAVGDAHSCAIVTYNMIKTIACWGSTKLGQQGPNAKPAQINLFQVVGTTDTLALASGSNHTCALVNGTNKGSVWCWGADDSGQSAGAITGMYVSTNNGPLSGLAVLAAGLNGSFASDTQGSYYWGDDSVGQLSGRQLGLIGNNPQALFDPVGPQTQAALGATHSCAVSGGALSCWGHGDALGGTSLSMTSTKVTVKLSKVTMVAVGTAHTCAIAASSSNPSVNSVYCWGDDSKYQLGDNGKIGTSTITPVEISLAPE